MKQRIILAGVIITMSLCLIVFGADIGDIKTLKPLTDEQVKALNINNITLQKVVDDALDLQIQKAKRKMTEKLIIGKTLTQLSVLAGDPNIP